MRQEQKQNALWIAARKIAWAERDTARSISWTRTLRPDDSEGVRWSGFALFARYVTGPQELRVQHRFRTTQDLWTPRARETVRDILELNSWIDPQCRCDCPELARVDPPFKPLGFGNE